MSGLPQLDVLAVGAHPDDVKIAVGGTLARLVKDGYQVGIVDLTDGEPTPLSPGHSAAAGHAGSMRCVGHCAAGDIHFFATRSD